MDSLPSKSAKESPEAISLSFTSTCPAKGGQTSVIQCIVNLKKNKKKRKQQLWVTLFVCYGTGRYF